MQAFFDKIWIMFVLSIFKRFLKKFLLNTQKTFRASWDDTFNIQESVWFLNLKLGI